MADTQSLPPVSSRTIAFPRMRWIAMTWLLVWGTSYAQVWGWANFLHLCDLAVILTCLGLWRGSSLLISMQAISSIVPALFWDMDFSWRLFSGKHLVGGTEYMWDPRFPLGVRLLSLFHVDLAGVADLGAGAGEIRSACISFSSSICCGCPCRVALPPVRCQSQLCLARPFPAPVSGPRVVAPHHHR